MNKSSKILIATGIFTPEIGGPASYAKTLATRLALSQKVTVITYSSIWSFQSDSELPFNVVRIWSKWPKGIKHLIYFFKALGQARTSDAVFALNAISAGVPARFAAKIFKKTFTIKIVGDAAWEKAINTGKTSLLLNDFQNSKRKGMIKLLHATQVGVCRAADIIIVPSEYLAGIVKGWGVPGDTIKVIYNGVDFPASPLSKEDARKKLGISGNVILSAGRLVPWKGFRMLIKLMPRFQEVNPFFQLVIAGEGPDRPFLEMMIKNLHLERRVTLVGKKSQSELAEYLAASDMFILNTGYEGFSHQILEVMQIGVPIITTSAGGNTEVIHQGENGLMVRYNDEFNLTEAVRVLWNNKEMQEKFIENGKETAKHFSVEKMFNETIELLKHV